MLSLYRRLCSRVVPCIASDVADSKPILKVDAPGNLDDSKQGSISTADTLSELPSSNSSRNSSSDASSAQSDVSQIDVEIVSTSAVKQAMLEKLKVGTWSSRKFEFKKSLQAAPRNHGSVDLMQELGSGKFVAVKKMPNKWMTADARTFRESYPNSTEQPWWDLAVLKCLEDRAFPYLCKSFGIFRDANHTYVVSSLASEGDLLSFCDCLPKPGQERVTTITPLMRDLFIGVKMLHEMGIAHGDLSLENVVVDRDANKGFRVKIIDFGMSSLLRMQKGPLKAKPSYTAPEAYESQIFDRFLADNFALGVMLYGLLAADYIWYSTKPGGCDRFSRATKIGLRKCLRSRRVRTSAGDKQFVDMVPESVVDTIVGLAAFTPGDRITLGESCWANTRCKSSVWDMAWLRPGEPEPRREKTSKFGSKFVSGLF